VQNELMRVMVTVTAYPNLSEQGETMCVAGVRLDGPGPELIRLYPVGYRRLPEQSAFHKYQIIEVGAHRSSADSRPESYRPDLTSVKIVANAPSRHEWAARWASIGNLAGATTCCGLVRDQLAGGGRRSLGLIKPRVTGVKVERAKPFSPNKQELAELAAAADLFGESTTPLEPAPYKLWYSYRCSDEPLCHGHEQMLIDWEAGAAARRWLAHGYPEDKLPAMLRQKFLDELCGPGRDTYFYIGNQVKRPSKFLVLGVFWPPAGSRPEATLFS
jgi:hypothetical protein